MFSNDKKSLPNKTRKEKSSLMFALLLVGLLAFISLSTGAYDILGKEDGLEMFFISRLPRTLSLMLAGAAMSICGLVMQLITQNRFVEPTTTGTIEWAGLGLLCVYIFIPGPSMMQRMTGAILFSFFGTLAFFFLLQKVRLRSSFIVPLVGIMLGSLVSAISTFLALQFDLNQTLEIWFQGSFSNIERGRYEYLWFIIIITFVIYKFADRLTLVGLGKDISTILGLSYNKIILLANTLVAIAVGIVSAVIGNLPFLGLIVPNIVAMIRGDDLKSNLPWVGLGGMAIIMLSDILARLLVAPFEIPVSLILGSFGSLIFISILLRQRRSL